MRAGACALQQTLTTEAASVLKHSLSLARRRGHAQVTPLHVAATLLSSRFSLLRRACLKSQPNQAAHPLQCRALELCFNVALNRLPANPGPILHGQPSFSNALIAALKRAQAHQRRGCIEQQQQQQQPLLAIKVELEQLILSILDDPSVSRVMREAGFSSTVVKNNLEDSSVSSVFQCYNTSGGIYSTPNSPPTETSPFVNPTNFWHSHLLSYSCEQNPLLFSPQKRFFTNNPVITDGSLSSTKEDVKLVFEVMLSKKRRNAVILGDSLSIVEGLVSEMMGKIEKGEVPEELKSASFIKFQFFSSAPLKFMKRDEIELNISELKRKVESFALSNNGGVIIYTGDLKWAVEDTSVDEREGGFSTRREFSGYSPVDHLIAEVGKLVSFYNNSSNSNTRVWLLATANYQTYMKCQMKQTPLDVQWSLQAVSVPSGGLGLSLNATSLRDSRVNFPYNPLQARDKKPFSDKEEQDALLTCPECTSNYEKEAASLKSSHLNTCNNNEAEKGSSQLPYWLKPHSNNASDKDDIVELRRKWNRLCQSLHQGRNNNQNHVSTAIGNQGYQGRSHFYTSYPCWPSQNSLFAESKSISFADPSLKPNQIANSFPRFRRQQSCHIEFSFSNGSSKCQPNLDSLKSMDGKEVKITLALGNSLSSPSDSEKGMLNAHLHNILQENMPWQTGAIPSVIEGLMDSKAMDRETWLLIQGNDFIGKRRLARGIAESLFGSSDLVFCMKMSENMNGVNSSAMLQKALRSHEKLVVLVEEIELADADFAGFLAQRFHVSSTDDKGRCNAIFILTEGAMPDYISRGDDLDSVIQMNMVLGESSVTSGVLSLDQKRKVEWDSPNKNKCQRNNEMEHVSSISANNVKRDFIRQSSSNALDLNIKADEDEENEHKTNSLTTNQGNPLKFLEKIKSRFILNQDSTQRDQMKEMFLSKIRKCFEGVIGSRDIGSFSAEETVLEGIVQESGSFLNSLFEKWLKDIFQTSLEMYNGGRMENVNARLCYGGKADSRIKDGFMNSCLPKRIQFSFIE